MSFARTFSGWLHAQRPNGNATPDPESPDLEAQRLRRDSHRMPIPSVLQALVNTRELGSPIPSQHWQPRSEPIVPGSLTSEHHPIAQKPMPLVQISAPSVQTPIPWNVDNQRHHIHPNGSVYWTCTVLGIQLVRDVEPLVPDQGVLEALENIRIRSDSADWCIYTGGEDWRYVHHRYELASNTLESILQIRNPDQSATNSNGLLLQANYWSFMQSHPSCQVGRINVKKVLQRTKEALVWCHVDRVLFGTNAPFSRADAREMTELIKTLAELDGPTLKIWYCAAILRAIAEARSASHYGQADAREVRRVEREDDIDWDYPLERPWDWVVWHLVIFFSLGSAATYQKRINNVDRTDSKFGPGGINTLRWRALLKALCKEWADINLLATVLVSSAVALLSISGNSRFVQIAVLISALCGISSVLSGMFLISIHQARTETFGTTANLYFRRIKSRGTNTSRPLAVILGLPLSLMLWGMIWLVSAIIGFAYGNGLDQHSAVTRFLPLAVTGMFVMLGIAIVYMLYGVWRPDIRALIEQRFSSAQPNRVPTNVGAARFGNPIVRPSGNQRTGAESA